MRLGRNGLGVCGADRVAVVIELRYFDTVTIKHKDTKVLLHSHAEKYPLRYDDGRVSSQGASRSPA